MKFYLFFIFIYFFIFTKEELKLTNARRYLSPNYDNVKDDISFPIKIKDNAIIEKYIVNILQKKNDKFKVIRTFESVNDKETLKAKKFKFKNWVNRLFEKKKDINVPEKITWDGMDNNQLPVNDGVYYIQATVFDNSKNKTVTKPIPIVLDNVSPIVIIDMKDFIFSPNGDKRKEQINIGYQLQKNKLLDRVLVEVKDQNNKLVKLFENDGSKQKFNFFWDGKNSSNKEAKQGFYKIDFTVYDLAGNTNQKKVKQIFLQREYEKAFISSSKQKLSPNKDGLFDDMVIMPRLSSEERLRSWQVKIKDSKNKEVFLFKGKNKLTKNLLFYGKDKKNKVLKDGKYSVQFFSQFTSGNIPKSDKIFITVDNTPPKFNIKLQNKTFNPLAKNGRKKLSIDITKDNDPLIKYTCLIKNKQGEIVYRDNYGFTTIPKTFHWDGKQKDGSILSGQYTYTLKGIDDVGNNTVVVSKSFELLMGNLQVDIFSEQIAFSPNGDKVKDTTTFNINVSKKHHKVFKGAEISIYFEDNKSPVWQNNFKTYQQKITWNGRDKKNKKLKDGKYFYSVLATFKTEEIFQTKKKEIYIDTIAPQIQLALKDKIFSPNGDNRKDSIMINQKKESNFLTELDQFKMQIANEKGIVQRIAEWKGDQFPQQYVWQGDNLVNEIVPNGKYFYQILAQDQAGNRLEKEINNITVVNDFEEMTLTLSQNLITRNSTPFKDYHSIKITPNFSRKDFLQKIIYQLPHQEEWQEINNNKKIILSQKDLKSYSKNELKINAKAYFSSGNLITATSEEITIDDIAPQIQVKTYPRYFSPDNDGKNETLQLYANLKDNSTIQKVDGILYRKIEFDSKGNKFEQTLNNYQKNKIDVFKNFDWQNKTKIKDLWNGVSEGGQLVESANDYILFVVAVDKVGNQTITSSDVTVDVFIKKLPDGRLKIVINNINFAYNSASMIGSYVNVLDRIAHILRKFPNYRIEIIGHTDSIGSDNYNNNLSKKRAKSVYDYLVATSISEERLSYDGMGKRELLIENESELEKEIDDPVKRENKIAENYRRNRRVEFYLIKNEEEKEKL